MKALRILAGRSARAHIAQHGLQASDVRAIPAAAGGPKGLLLKHLDQYLFGEFLAPKTTLSTTEPATESATSPATATRPIHLVGASVGSWRMACASSANPVTAFDELTRLYMTEQRYESKASRQDIDAVCARILDGLIDPIAQGILDQSRYALHLVAVRGIGALSHPTKGHKRGFSKAVVDNLWSRQRLSRSLERVAFHHGNALPFLPPNTALFNGFDGLPTRNLTLDASNLKPVLAASGAIPLLISPIQSIAGAPPGPYWDGGISDYHIHWPWPCLGGITLFPHFSPHIIPGWLDKFFKHRRAHRLDTAHWLDNTVLLCPSDDFVRSLPKQKIPDRGDFKLYGLDWRAREASWNTSISAARQLADEFAAFVAAPEQGTIELLN